MSDLIEYAAWKLQQAKTLLHMPDVEIAKMVGSARPTVQAWRSNPARMPVGALAALEDHLELVAAADKIEDLYIPAGSKPRGYLSAHAEKLLAEFNYDAEYCHGYKFMDGGKSPENVAAIAELKQHGMLEFYRGLMTEDGEVAGSGWCRSKKGNAYVEEFQL